VRLSYCAMWRQRWGRKGANCAHYPYEHGLRVVGHRPGIRYYGAEMRVCLRAGPKDFTWKRAFLLLSCIVLNSCRWQQANVGPSIEFTRIPQADDGGREKHDIIEGRVAGLAPGS
jgi:hypothetical protein